MNETKESTSEKIIKGNFYTIMQTYGSFFITILSSFFIARLLSEESWGFLILGLYTVSIFGILFVFFPPATNLILNQYIPQYNYKNEIDKLRSMIYSILFLRILISLVCWIIFFLIFIIFINQNILFQIYVILSPIIVFEIIISTSAFTLRGFYKFKEVAIINLSRILLLLVLYIIIFFNSPENPIILLSFANVLSYLISVFFSIIFIIRIVPKAKKKNNLLNFRQLFKISKEFGIYFQVSSSFKEGILYTKQNFLFYSGNPEYLTYYKISRNTRNFALQASGASGTPLLSIFSELSAKKQYEKLENALYMISKYGFLIHCIITAILFFFIDVYILIIYTENYLSIAFLIQILLFEGVQYILFSYLNAILVSLNKVKLIIKRDIIFRILDLVFSLFIIYFWGFSGYIIFVVLISFFNLIVNLLIFKTRYVKEVNVKIWPILKMVILFLISLIISLIFSFFFFNLINFGNFLVHDIFKMILKDSIELGVFFIVFYLIIYVTKTITKEEINELLSRDIFSRNLKGLNKNISKVLIRFFPRKDKEKEKD